MGAHSRVQRPGCQADLGTWGVDGGSGRDLHIYQNALRMREEARLRSVASSFRSRANEAKRYEIERSAVRAPS